MTLNTKNCPSNEHILHFEIKNSFLILKMETAAVSFYEGSKCLEIFLMSSNDTILSKWEQHLAKKFSAHFETHPA